MASVTQSAMDNAETIGVIAIDGPSGSGKSTVSRGLAKRLSVPYLDTGAMYRAATWAVLSANVDTSDSAAVAKVVADHHIEVGIDPTAPSVDLDGVDVRGPIRGPEVTAAVSAVAAVPEVRRLLVAEQQRIIAAAMRGETEFDGLGIVVEGRDIATVVAPDAVLKVYLTASSEARANRRRGETTSSRDAAQSQAAASETTTADLTDVRRDLARRDALDSSRKVDPLRQDDSAVLLDTTTLSVADVIDELLRLHAAAATAH